MHEFQRLRLPAVVRFNIRDQSIFGTGLDPQFQVGRIVGHFVRSDDFHGITAGNQRQRELSRA